MRRLLLLLLFIISLEGYSQTDSATSKSADIYRVYDSVQSKQEQDNNIRNFLALAEMQKERRAKEKREALLRIGLGVVFLVILVVGLMRRRKK